VAAASDGASSAHCLGLADHGPRRIAGCRALGGHRRRPRGAWHSHSQGLEHRPGEILVRPAWRDFLPHFQCCVLCPGCRRRHVKARRRIRGRFVSPVAGARRKDQVIARLRSGTSTSARIATSGGWPGPGVTVSVRQIAEPLKRLPLGSAGSSSARRFTPDRGRLAAAGRRGGRLRRP
jgi:hypothetical protein